MNEYSKFKSRLTRAKNSGDPRKVIRVCDEFERYCETNGWPDWWSLFEIARRDAEFTLTLQS